MSRPVVSGAPDARILVIDGCPADTTVRTVALGGKPYGEAYALALSAALPEARLEFHVLSIACGERLPQGVALSDFAGIAWTGSPLSAYDDDPAVTRQLDLARDVFQSGVPSFGSCWGLQIMCKALGGEVRPNPRGYEIGIARNISQTDAGRRHVMYGGRPAAFDALAIHRDEVSALPAGAVVLAANAMSAVQAVDISAGASSFWGVQYHPEFDLATMALLMRRNADQLVRDGFVASTADAHALSRDLSTLHAEPGHKHLAWRYGVADEVLDAKVHKSELTAWLRCKVLPAG